MTPNRRGMSLLEVLVLLVVCALLIAFLLPPVRGARDAARRTQCKNNLKQIGIALHDYHDIFNTLPPGVIEYGGQPDRSIVAVQTVPDGAGCWAWSAFIVPVIDANSLFKLLNVGNETVASVLADSGTTGDSFRMNRRIEMQRNLSVFNCPSSPLGPKNLNVDRRLLDDNGVLTEVSAASYVAANNHWGMFSMGKSSGDGGLPYGASSGDAPSGTFWMNSKLNFNQIRDGTSNMIMVGERREFHGKRKVKSAVMFAAPRSHGLLEPSAYQGIDPNYQDTFRPAPLSTANHNCGLFFCFGDGLAKVNENSDYAESGFSSHHSKGAQFVMGDGRVVFISDKIDHNPETAFIDSVYERLLSIRDGQKVEPVDLF